MMKVLLLLGLLALVETRWVGSDSPFRSVNELELEEEGNQLQEHVISELLRNLQNLDDKRELAAENNEADNLEDHSLEGNEKGETRWVRNDSPLQSISDEESVEKGSQSQELGINKLLRNLQNLDDKRELAAENNEADNLEDHSLEGDMKGETRWVRNDSPLQSISDEESEEKGSQSQELGISKLLRNLQNLDDKRELAAENNEADNLEDHSLEGDMKGEIRWIRNDSPLQSISDEESEEKGSQSQELGISKLLRNLQNLDDKRELAAENNEADNLEDHSLEGNMKGETRWVRNDSPLQSISDEESEEKGSQSQELGISKLLRNLQNLDDKRELAAENNEADNLEDHSLEGDMKGEIRWIRNDSPLQSISDEESEEKGSQSQELGISKLLRNLQNLDDKRELAAENNEADNLEDHSLEGNMKGETRWVRNDIPLQSISDEESEEKGSQSQELVISKFLRSLEEGLGNEENDWDESLKNYRSDKRANAHHVNDESSGRREDIELLDSLAQQANDIASEKQRDLDQYKNRRLAVDVGKPVSNPSGNPGSHGFMEIPVDNQPMDETIYRY